jgi:hypothetical protein
MPVIDISGFNGSNKALSPRLLNESVGADALNLEPGLGEFRPLHDRLTVATIPTSPQRKTIVGMSRDGSNNPQYFLGWSAVVNQTSGFDGSDTTERIYYSGDGSPKFTNNSIGLGGGPPYPQASRELAVPAPTTPATLTLTTDGTGTEAARYYVHTFVNDLGWESAPSPLSAALTCKDGAIVDIASLPSAPAGNYGITLRRIYRTQSDSSSNADFYFLREIAIGTTSTTDDARALGDLMATTGWRPPPSTAYGLIALWNSMFAMLDKKTVIFCEPGSPYAYPVKYDIDLKDLGVATATWEQNLLVLTTGRPVLIQGQDPAGMTDTRLALSQPCASATSVAMFGHGACWASKDGAAYAGSSGQAILTKGVLTSRQWRALKPQTMIGGRWRNFYIVSYEVSGGRKAFMLDPLNPAGGIWWLSTGFDACWYDEQEDELYVLEGGNVRRFDGADSILSATFLSKVFRQVKPMNYGYAKVVADSYPVTIKVWSDQRDPVTGSITMPLRITKTVTGPASFALPSGFVSEDWQVEVSGAVNVQSVRLATDPSLLKGA